MTTRNVPADKGAERALEIVDDFTKLLITLAAGAAALSVTFIGSVYRGHKLGLLAVAWGLLALSLLCGMLARGTYIGQVAVGRTEVRRGLLEILNSAQLLALIAAVALFGATVLLNLHSGPKILALRDAAKVDSGVSRCFHSPAGPGTPGVATCASASRVPVPPDRCVSPRWLPTSVPASTSGCRASSGPAPVPTARPAAL